MTARQITDLAAELLRIRQDPEAWAKVQAKAKKIKEGKQNG